MPIHAAVELFMWKQDNDSIIDHVETIKLKSAVVSTQYGDGWLPSVYKEATIAYNPNTNWTSDTYEDCDNKEQRFFNSHAKDWLIAAIGVKRCSMKMPEGGNLKPFLRAHSATSNNAATYYPSAIAALFRLL